MELSRFRPQSSKIYNLLLMIRPVRCEDFKCFSAQKEIKGFGPLLIQDLVQKFIKIGSLPSAVGKSAAGVLVKKIITSPLPAHNFASSTSLNE